MFAVPGDNVTGYNVQLLLLPITFTLTLHKIIIFEVVQNATQCENLPVFWPTWWLKKLSLEICYRSFRRVYRPKKAIGDKFWSRKNEKNLQILRFAVQRTS